MKKLLFVLLLSASCFGFAQTKKACVIATDFIKDQLKYPDEAKISQFNCIQETNEDGTFTVLNKVIAKNGFGVKTEYIFKLNLFFLGGEWTEKKNWKLVKIQYEEYRP